MNGTIDRVTGAAKGGFYELSEGRVWPDVDYKLLAEMQASTTDVLMAAAGSAIGIVAADCFRLHDREKLRRGLPWPTKNANC